MLTERIDRARDLCRQWVHDGHTPTLGVCVARRGVIILHEALDMTTFGHMFLNRGRFGGARILSLAAVAAMTRDQVPGIGARFFERVMPHASWGYGWQIESPTKWPYFHGSLQLLGTFSHPGAGGAIFWIDRVHELVGCLLRGGHKRHRENGPPVEVRSLPKRHHLGGGGLMQLRYETKRIGKWQSRSTCPKVKPGSRSSSAFTTASTASTPRVGRHRLISSCLS